MAIDRFVLKMQLRKALGVIKGLRPHLGLCRAAYLDPHATEFARIVVRQQNDLLKAAAKLTPRERQVLALVVRGWLNRQIAHELSIAEGTVVAHRKKIMQRAKIKTRAQLVSFAERLAMIGVL